MSSLIKTTALNFSEHPSAPAPTAYGPRLSGAASVVRIRDRRHAAPAELPTSAPAEDASADPVARMERKLDEVAAEVRTLGVIVAGNDDGIRRIETRLTELLDALVGMNRPDVPTDADR